MGLRPAVTVTEYGSVVYPPINESLLNRVYAKFKHALITENDETFLSIMTTYYCRVRRTMYRVIIS